MKISQKLIVILLASSLIPLMGAGVLSYSITQGTLSDQIHSQLDKTANHQIQRTDETFHDAATKLGLFVNKLQIRLFIDELSRSDRSAARQNLTSALQDVVNQEPTYVRIHILTPGGSVLASTDNDFVGRNYADQEVFAVGQTNPTNDIFFKDEKTSELRRYSAAPLELSKRKIGIVVIESRVDSLLLITGDYSELERTGETYLVKKSAENQLQYLTPLRFKPNASLTNAGSLTNGVDYRGKRVIWVQHALTSSPELSLIAKIDQDEVNTPLVRLRNLSIALLAGTTLLVLLSAWRLSGFIAKPIKRLTDAAIAISQGDLTHTSLGNFSQQTATSRRDEIGILGNTFGQMARKLDDSYRALEQKVTDRTKELNQKVVELGDAKAKDDAILGSIGDGMVVTDNVGTVLLMNKVAADLLGVDMTQVIGKPFNDCKLYDDAGAVLPADQTPLAQALASGHNAVQDVTAMNADGMKKALSINATTVLQQQRVIGVVALVRDITKAKEVDRMKTEFISLASHQLRTPLSAIKWFSEMLVAGDAGKLEKEQFEFAQNIVESTERMIDLVNSLLNISRIESGRIIIDPKPTDLGRLVGGIITDLKGKTEEKQQTLIVSVHKDLPQINLDPRLIGQVYLNLLTNAIKYTPKGGEITVLISRKDDMAISQVTDNGYGIPKTEQVKMFQKFFRATNIAKVETDGTGLGMYLVKSIIESSGGKIWFQSEEGKGTTFWFSIPLSGMKAKAGEVTIGD